MNRKETLKALYSAEDIDLLVGATYAAEIGDFSDSDYFELLTKEDTKTRNALNPKAKGRIDYMTERDNVLHALLVRNYYKDVLARKAVMFHDASDRATSNGWFGWCVWIEGVK